MSTGRLMVGALLLTTGIWGAQACAGSTSADETLPGTGGSGGVVGECTPGVQINCACPGGGQGVQRCLPSGLGYGSCDCSSVGGGGGSDPCGDGFCDSGATPAPETCRSCEADCGACAPCDIAPSCDGAMIAPSVLNHKVELDISGFVLMPQEQLREQLAAEVARGSQAVLVVAAALEPEVQPGEHPVVSRLRAALQRNPAAASKIRAAFADAGMGDTRDYLLAHATNLPGPMILMDDEFPGGTIECGAPLLRIGIQKIHVIDPEDAPETDEIYCLVEAEAQAGAEIRVTPLVENLSAGDEHVFSNEAGVIWGANGPRTPGSDVLLTYNCIESDDSAQYQALIDAIGEGAGDIGDVYDGAYGWVFPVIEGVSGVVSSAMAANGDDKIFNVQQQIPLADELEMTNGEWWSVRQSGGSWPNSWDWELIVRGWGCAQFGTL
jgi:hypothetical protein